MDTIANRFRASMTNLALHQTIVLLVLVTTGAASLLTMICTFTPTASDNPVATLLSMLPFGIWLSTPFLMMYFAMFRLAGNQGRWSWLARMVGGEPKHRSPRHSVGLVHLGVIAICIYTFYIQWAFEHLSDDATVASIVLLPLYQLLALAVTVCLSVAFAPYQSVSEVLQALRLKPRSATVLKVEFPHAVAGSRNK